MIRILIVYGTTYGHTGKIAEALATTFRHRGALADIVQAARGEDEIDPDAYAAVVIAASVRAGHFQQPVQEWVRANAGWLGDRPTAFVSVCLGVLQHDAKVDADIAAMMDRFCEATHWTPTTRKVVAGALLYTHYSWLTRWIMRRIAAKAHGDTDTSRDFEYTDWKDLETFADLFFDQHVAPVAKWWRSPTPAA
jgi:menaquinone-dependent protoporphyrinogen oxidase